MISGQRVLGLITARGGSKGLPRKNVLPLAGKPLIAWTIEAARASKYLDRLVLSTDDEEITQVARAFGCEVPFRRPAHLAADDTPGIAPVVHALDQLEPYDYVVLLQPTSPLRTTTDLDSAIEKCVGSGAPSCVSVVEVEKPLQWMFTLEEGDRMVSVAPNDKVQRRQETPAIHMLNGAVYVADVGTLRQTEQFITSQTVAYTMPRVRSVDVDGESDLILCEAILSRR